MTKFISLKFVLLSTSLFLCSTIAKSDLIDMYVPSDNASHNTRMRLSISNVQDGPADRFCVNAGGPFTRRDFNGNFLNFVDEQGQSYTYLGRREFVTYESPALGNPVLESLRVQQRQALNAFATVSYTKRLIGADLERVLPQDHPAMNLWRSQQPVKIYALDRDKRNNAEFRRDGSIHFYPLVTRTGQIIGNTASDFDTASHETGHNISYVLRPDRDLTRPQTAAIEEGLGDFIALTTALSLNDVSTQFLRDTAGDLRRSSFLSEMAESLSTVTGAGTHGIRNAVNTFTLRDSPCEAHALSRVFTGALYDILANVFEDNISHFWAFFFGANEDSRKANLSKFTADIRGLVLSAHCYVPYANPSFSDFGKAMLELAENNHYYSYLVSYISAAFENRGIDLNAVHTNDSMCDRNATHQHGAGGFVDNHVCGTLSRCVHRHTRH